LKTSTTRGRNMFVGNRSQWRPSFAWVVIITVTPQKRATLETKSTQMGLVMVTFTNVRTPLINNTMSIQWREDCKARGEMTWIFFYETWNPAIFTMVTKTICTTSCEAIFSPPCTQWKRCIPIGSKGWLQM